MINKLRIGIREFEVKENNAMDRLAAVTSKFRTIEYNNLGHVCEDELKISVCHEVLHAMYDCIGDGPDRDAEDSYERRIEALGTILFQVIRDNPELTKWIQNDPK
jgi:hypothetical protein